MNTEPPTGDDMQRMLVSMKQTVLEQAREHPAPRPRRRVGITVAVVALISIGTASGAAALGFVPTPFVAAPAPSASPTEPVTPSATASGPVVATPTPTAPTPTPTPSARRYSPSDPGTWTISGSEVGPVALGGPVDGEIDDLPAAYTLVVDGCPNPNVSMWSRPGAQQLTVQAQDGVVTGIAVGLDGDADSTALVTSPVTAEGAGVGTTLTELQALYPDLAQMGSYGNDAADPMFSFWSIQRDGHFITFQLSTSGTTVGMVWVSDTAQPPYEFCG